MSRAVVALLVIVTFGGGGGSLLHEASGHSVAVGSLALQIDIDLSKRRIRDSNPCPGRTSSPSRFAGNLLSYG